jgi:hypothetical protein
MLGGKVKMTHHRCLCGPPARTRSSQIDRQMIFERHALEDGQFFARRFHAVRKTTFCAKRKAILMATSVRREQFGVFK